MRWVATACPVVQEPAASKKVAARKIEEDRPAPMATVRGVDNARDNSGSQRQHASPLMRANKRQVLNKPATTVYMA